MSKKAKIQDDKSAKKDGKASVKSADKVTAKPEVKIPMQTLEAPITCQGISVRTNNLAETREGSAKLGKLWQKFYQSHAANVAEDADVYGIYHNYERDDTGEFDVVASWEEGRYQSEDELADQADAASISSAEMVTVTIPAGKYLVFSESGVMPDMVIEAWEKVWTYFNDPSCPHTRTYEVDFEKYIGGNLERGQVDVYIGVR